MITNEDIMARLREQAEPAYAKFSSALIPGCPRMLGVRIPALRRLAQELAKQAPESLACLTDATFEEQMLRGLVIAYAKTDPKTRRRWLTEFAAGLGNWSVCDSTAATCRFMAKESDFWLPWLCELSRDAREFPSRFAIVCLMDHFSNEASGRRLLLECCAAATCPALYTRLAVAWAVSVAAVKEPPLGLDFLQNDTLDAFTHNKSIQKICESRRATPDYRAAVRSLRR